MKIFKLNLEAGETREVNVNGSYFEVRKALYPVDVVLLDGVGGNVSLLEQSTESDYTREGVYQAVRVTNGATAQSIQFWYGFGDAGSRRFSGNVSGSVEIGAASLAALESVSLNAPTLDLMKRPDAFTHFGSDNLAMAANIPQTYLLPATNVNGAIVQYLMATDLSTSNGCRGGWLAKASAPINVNDGVPLAGFQIVAASTSTIFYKAELTRDVFIPAGLGVHYIQDTLSTAGERHQFRIRVL